MSKRKPTIKYYIIKVVNGVEVQRTEVKATKRDKITGRFIGNAVRKAAYRRIATCPACGATIEF